jgi:hypothetical protein
MRVHVVADVHGNSEALARAGEGADALLVLGDLIDFVDYQDHGGGILGRIFGAEVVGRFARIRVSGRPGELGEYARALWAGLADPRGTLEDAVREQYREIFGVLAGCPPCYLTPGNVDLPHLWPEFLTDGLHALDGETVELDGLRLGFVGGLPLPPSVSTTGGGPWRPYSRPRAEFDAACARLAGGGPAVQPRSAEGGGAGLRRGRPPRRGEQRGVAGAGRAAPTPRGPVRARASAAVRPGQGGRDRVRQRRALPKHRPAVPTELVTPPDAPRAVAGSLRAWPT